jgi:hypothetical protein
LDVILLIIVLFLIIAAFTKKEVKAEKEVIINKSKAEVFTYIKLLKNQENYGRWFSLDSTMKKKFTGVDGTLGFVYSWESNNKEVGFGEQEIKKITEGEGIDFELRFKKPIESTSQAYMITEAIDSATTKVKWGFEGKMPYPFNAMLLFVSADEMCGNDFRVGLDNLKRVMEK